MGSGAYVHFIGAARALSPSQLDALTARALSVSLGEAEAKRLLAALASSLAQHELVEASLDLERSTLPWLEAARLTAFTPLRNSGKALSRRLTAAPHRHGRELICQSHIPRRQKALALLDA